ncbi:MAG: DUF2971 domain-containing protein [Pseudomonadota bacterium]
MGKLRGYMSPLYSDEARDDALFHYTTAAGLIGILESKELWSTAYFCTNDESELTAGTGILKPMFWRATHDLVDGNDPMVQTFNNRGVDIFDYARDFEQHIIGHIFHLSCAYITCFCKPTSEEDFKHGLLSQWRAYGVDGGYALQFSRRKLEAAIEKAYKEKKLNYDLQDVYYTEDNPLKAEVESHENAFVGAYIRHLQELADQNVWQRKSFTSPLSGLFDGAFLSLVNFLIQTKNRHFSEENECRLTLLEAVASEAELLPVNYFNREGLVVPYKRTPHEDLPILDCIEWIIIGPSTREDARYKSVSQMVKTAGLEIEVRPSRIPFVRF